MRKIMLIGLVLLMAMLLFADPPTGGGKTLAFATFSNGGTEAPAPRTGTTYVLSDVLGRGVSAAATPLGGATYDLYGGFRFVDLDIRAPFSEADTPDTVSSSAMFYVSWSGVDTTIEDGEGWGVRYYDVQWRKSTDASGVWHDWMLQTTLEHAWFGPYSPDTVKEDTVYYFRTRAYDLVANREDYVVSDTGDAHSRYQPPTLTFEISRTNGDSIWVTDSVSIDTFVVAPDSCIFIVKNRGTNAIDIGIYTFPTAHWYPGWTADWMDTFSVRAIFNDLPNAPVASSFDDSTVVLDTLVFASPNRFGTGGINLLDATADSVDRTDNLWFRVNTPKWVSEWTGDEMIILKLEARNTIY